ncbi:hypothetical protein GGR58DRAFT_496887 [Xylaria digitata]|nr:hypothetical protein GGR58DRAFT_496887 [Xylaria digitata]
MGSIPLALAFATAPHSTIGDYIRCEYQDYTDDRPERRYAGKDCGSPGATHESLHYHSTCGAEGKPQRFYYWSREMTNTLILVYVEMSDSCMSTCSTARSETFYNAPRDPAQIVSSGKGQSEQLNRLMPKTADSYLLYQTHASREDFGLQSRDGPGSIFHAAGLHVPA